MEDQKFKKNILKRMSNSSLANLYFKILFRYLQNESVINSIFRLNSKLTLVLIINYFNVDRFR